MGLFGGMVVVDMFCELMIPLFMLTFVLIVVEVDDCPSDHLLEEATSWMSRLFAVLHSSPKYTLNL